MQYTFYKDIGGRTKQEDSVGIFELENYLFIVLADGMGGHKGGEIASSTLVEVAKSYFHLHSEMFYSPFEFFTSIINETQYRLKERYIDTSFDPNTTFVMALIIDNILYYCHIGDSRLYIFEKRKGLIFRTRDDSVPEMLFQQKKIKEEEIDTHPQQNILTKSLSMKSTDTASFGEMKLSKSKEYIALLASDGLWAKIKPKEIYKELFYSKNSFEFSIKNLLNIAKDRGGENGDNISIASVVIEKKEHSFGLFIYIIFSILLLFGFGLYFFDKEKSISKEQNRSNQILNQNWNIG